MIGFVIATAIIQIVGGTATLGAMMIENSTYGLTDSERNYAKAGVFALVTSPVAFITLPLAVVFGIGLFFYKGVKLAFAGN